MTPVRDSRKRGTTGLDPRKTGIGPHTPSAVTYEITGFTRDYDTQAIIPSCDVHLFRASDDLEIAQTTSDGAGYFFFNGLPDNTTDYYLVAYKTGAPDQAGTTLNTLRAA